MLINPEEAKPIHTVASVQITAFRDVMPCSLVNLCRCFGGIYCLILHGVINMKTIFLNVYLPKYKTRDNKFG